MKNFVLLIFVLYNSFLVAVLMPSSRHVFLYNNFFFPSIYSSSLSIVISLDINLQKQSGTQKSKVQSVSEQVICTEQGKEVDGLLQMLERFHWDFHRI